MATLIVFESFTGTPGNNATSPATIFSTGGIGGSYTFATGPTGTGGQADQRQLIYEFAPLDLVAVEVSMYLPTLPTTNFNPKKLLLLSDTSFNNLTLRMLTTGILRFDDSVGTTWSGTVPVPAATNFRVVMDVDTLADTVEVSLYIGANINGVTPDDVISATVASEEAIGTVILNAFASDPTLAVTYDDFYLYDATAVPPVPDPPDEFLSGRGWPPLVFTDLKRNYWTGTYPEYRALSTPRAQTYNNGSAPTDIYGPWEFGVNQLCRIPNGFQDQEFRNGLALSVQHQNAYSGTELGLNAVAYIHAKAQDSPAQYEQGWVSLDGSGVGGKYGPYGGNGGWSQIFLGPQRMGPYVYGIGVYQDYDNEKFALWRFNSSTNFEILESFSTTLYYGTRQEQSAFLKIFGSGSIFSGAILEHGNCEMFVSDERPATISFLGGRKVTWWDDDTDHGMYVTEADSSTSVSGPAWLNQQTFAAQDTDELPNPSLVFPWRSGDYGAPEVWFYKKIVNAGKYTGQIQIYASRFDGSEWDTDWDRAVNKLGTFGPIEGLQLEDPSRDLTNERDPFNIKVARNPRNHKQLRMIVDVGAQSINDPVFEYYPTRYAPPMMWLLDSYDDGYTWQRVRRFPVAKRGVYMGPENFGSQPWGREFGQLSFAVTDQGEAVCGVMGGTPTGRIDEVASPPFNHVWLERATLVYPDYTGKGKGEQESAKTNFRRPNNRETPVL